MHTNPPAQAKKAAKKSAKKRSKLKLGTTTIVIQRLKGGRAAVVTYEAGDKPGTRKRSKVEYTSLAEAQTAFERKEIEMEKVGAGVAGSVDDADKIAVSRFKAAVAGWVNPPTVADALDAFLAQKKAITTAGTVADAIDRRKAEAVRRGLSGRHREDLDLRLAKLKDAMGDRPLVSITPDCLKKWLAGLAVSPRDPSELPQDCGERFRSGRR